MPYGLYPPMPRSPVTYLTNGIDDSITTIKVDDITKLPTAPNIATIGEGADSETIRYEDKSADSLTGVTRGFEGEAKVWSKGTPIANVPCAQHIGALQEAVDGIEGRVEELEVLFAEGGRGDNGSFVRFNNGLQVCWNAMSSSALSVGLHLFSWTYPKAFSSAPMILPSLGIKTGHAGRGYAISGRSPGTTSTTIAVAVSTTMEGTATNIFMLAIGWWKEPGT